MSTNRDTNDASSSGGKPSQAAGSPEDAAGAFAAKGQTSDDPALKTGLAGKTKSKAQPGRTPGQAEGPPDVAT